MILPSLTSKKKILIICPPYRLSQASFPLGLMYIAAVLLKEGHHVEAVDMDVYNFEMDEYVKMLREREYDYLLTGGMITAWNFIVFTANFVKQVKPRVKVIAGGGIISSTPKSLISASQLDVGIIGEGEEVIVELINALENGTPLANVDGIIYKEDGKVIQTKPRAEIHDLDSLPFPAWETFRAGEIYTRFPSHFSVFKAKRIASIYTSRGCPFLCTFCYTEKAVRQRSVDNVIAEIKELKERYGVGHIFIVDDLFVVRKKRTIEFCEAMIKNKINVTWSATGRCNIIDPEFVKTMKAAGCVLVGLGIESGSSKVLTAIKKAQTPEMIVNAVKMVHEAGITPGGSFILGLPPETKETVKETVGVYKTINAWRTHVNRFFLATPYPGTPLYEEMKAKGRIGDEIQYFEKLSEAGDATEFLINCTDAFTDAELVQTKKEIEEECFKDFMKKHPWYGFYQFIIQHTFIRQIRNTLIEFKLKGFKEGVLFIFKKFLYKFKIIPDRFERRWNTKKSYTYQQTIIEGQTVTF